MGNSMQIMDLIHVILSRRKMLLLLPTICAIIGLVISLYVLTPVYRVQADLLVNQTKSGEDVPSTTDVEMSLRLIETYQFIINSSRVRELVVQNLTNDYSMREMERKFMVESNADTQIISLYIEDGDPYTASEIVNLYAETSRDEISNLMQMDNVRILTEAKADNHLTPVRPAPIFYTVISFLIGALLALMYITFSAYFNSKIHSRKDVERYLELPLLGSINMIFLKENRYKNHSTNPDDFIQFTSRKKKEKPDMEAFRALKINLEFQTAAKKLHSILITGTSKNEGKTVTATNLATVMAMDQKKTVFIDADLRKGAGTSKEGDRDCIGLTNYLSGFAEIDEIVKKTSVPHLHVINSGPMSARPTELLASLKMNHLLYELENKYDVIIIDSSPMDYADATLLATKVDGCIFINRAGKTNVYQAQQAIEQLKTVQATVVGAVLNNKKERKKAVRY